MPKLNKSFINQIKDEHHKDKVYTDDENKKLSIRIQGNKKTWILTYRIANRLRKMKLGDIYERSVDDVRNEALELTNLINRGIDPSLEKNRKNKEYNVSELCEIYMKEGTSHKKETTLKIDRGRIDRHIVPLIGKIKISELSVGDVDKMMIDIINGNKISITEKSNKPRGVSRVTGGKEASNRTIQLLSAILNFAIRRELIEKNPAKLVNKPKAGKKEVFLNVEEIKKLGKALRDEQHKDKKLAIQAIKLLLLTGCRRNEILSLRWDYVDFVNQCFRFPDTKTGKQIRPLGIGALKLLEEIKKESSSQWVFPATRGDGHYIGLPKAFDKICSSHPLKEDGTPDKGKPVFLEKEGLSLHSLRHSFASIASSLTCNEFTIAGLLGHRLRGVTSRYSHNVDKNLIASADMVSLYIKEALNG